MLASSSSNAASSTGWSEDDDGWQLLPATASPARTSDADADRADVPGRSPCGSKGMATVDKVECSAEWSGRQTCAVQNGR